MPSAIKDAKSIYDFIYKQSVQAAGQFNDRIYASIESLRRFPERGKIVKEFKNKALREIAVSKFRIIYRMHNEEVQILTIHHSARLLVNNPAWNDLFA